MTRQAYEIDGRRVESMYNLFDLTGEAVGGVGHYFGSNLDAFSDCLSGGFGTPDDGNFEFVLNFSEHVRAVLGYSATLAWLERTRAVVYPGNWAHIDRQIEDARAQRGRTIFDIVLEIFDEREVALALQ